MLSEDERGRVRAAVEKAEAGLAAEIVLFMGGLGWLAVLTHSMSMAIKIGLYWFVFAEVIKILMAAGVASR